MLQKMYFIFKVLYLVVLIYQIIDTTNIYPCEVKLNVTDYDSLNLPSITFCLKSDIFWDRFKSRGIFKVI